MRFSRSPIVPSRCRISRFKRFTSASSCRIAERTSSPRSPHAFSSSFFSSMVFSSTVNFFFMIPFSPLNRNVSSRSELNCTSKRSRTFSTSQSTSSSSCNSSSLNSRAFSRFSPDICPFSALSSSSLVSKSSAISRVYRACVPTVVLRCSSHRSTWAFRSAMRRWYSSTSFMMAFWYRASSSSSDPRCASSTCLSRSSYSIAMSFFSSLSSSYLFFSCSTSCANFSSTSFTFSLCDMSRSRSWYSLCS
mmetsp:Transcript_4664/g.8869  ORF Transcript_4664/g.8869 Transcript_4664/m.8869 type:complete len:248 (-) Transcript_4664:196-939(-)